MWLALVAALQLDHLLCFSGALLAGQCSPAHSLPMQIKHPQTGGDGYEPCAPMAPGAQECSLQYFADKGIADQVVPPIISMKDFLKVLDRARPTVSPKDLEVFERFTDEFGEEAS